jgi:hypothetical protein
MFGRVARDIRRLCEYLSAHFFSALIMVTIASVTSSPLFSIYGETISGLTVIRAFGMPTKFLKDMIICTDTVRMSEMIPKGYWLIKYPRT